MAAAMQLLMLMQPRLGAGRWRPEPLAYLPDGVAVPETLGDDLLRKLSVGECPVGYLKAQHVLLAQDIAVRFTVIFFAASCLCQCPSRVHESDVFVHYTDGGTDEVYKPIASLAGDWSPGGGAAQCHFGSRYCIGPYSCTPRPAAPTASAASS